VCTCQHCRKRNLTDWPTGKCTKWHWQSTWIRNPWCQVIISKTKKIGNKEYQGFCNFSHTCRQASQDINVQQEPISIFLTVWDHLLGFYFQLGGNHLFLVVSRTAVWKYVFRLVFTDFKHRFVFSMLLISAVLNVKNKININPKYLFKNTTKI